MRISYVEEDGELSIAFADVEGRIAIVSGLAPGEPIFAFRARDLAFPAAFVAWWAEVAESFTSERAKDTKASARALADWARQNPEQARMPD